VAAKHWKVFGLLPLGDTPGSSLPRSGPARPIRRPQALSHTGEVNLLIGHFSPEPPKGQN
jgi:hypothetical protein